MSTTLSYVPAFIHAAVSGTRPLRMTLDSVSRENLGTTSSFMYDPMGSPLKSTQQLNVDWAKFENHVFFSSAEAVVNMAFDKIVNGYPFDGTRTEVENFFDSLTGFEKWVFDSFPRYAGALGFSTSLGTHIIVKDHAGSSFPAIAKNDTGESVLNPRDGVSLSIESQIYIPAIANGNQIIAQKASGGSGFALYLSSSVSTDSCVATFDFRSGSTNATVSAELSKGEYTHVCAVLDRSLGPARALLYLDEELVASSSKTWNIGNIEIDDADFTIGSGSTLGTFVPTETFSGSLDEFRVFHSARGIDQQRSGAKKSLYATSDLRLYYRFNEPPPLIGGESEADVLNSIVLDGSGNSLHSFVTGFTGSLRESVSSHPENPVTLERNETTAVLFPAYSDVVDFNVELLTSASAYDVANPNLITRLIPSHYLEEGAKFDGYETIDGQITLPYTGSGIPGQGVMGSTQIILSFLYVWARFFDDVKLYIDAFRNVRYVDYDNTDTVPDNFLVRLAKDWGLYLPPLFNNSTLEQFIDGENIVDATDEITQPLKYVQNQLLRRVLINMPDVIRSKGTQHSIKAFLRSIGIDPDNSVRIREYGGPTSKQLTFARETKRETGYMAVMTSSALVTSTYLSASRTEVGYPYPAGTMINAASHPPHGISNLPSDGLFTSGSWSVEMHVKFPPSVTRTMSSEQSLLRLCTTGSNTSQGGVLFNLVAVSSSTQPQLILYGRPGVSSSSPVLQLSLNLSTGSTSHIFDGEHWNVSFGCQRSDEIDSLVSSSYYLRAGKTDGTMLESTYTTSSFFYDTPQGEQNALRVLSGTTNASGSFITIGTNQTLITGATSGHTFLNNTTVTSQARTTRFDGWFSNVRFWSKSVDVEEWYEHVRNYKSTGVTDPLTEWNFSTTNSGSFGRLRLDAVTRQETRYAAADGSLTLLDMSLANNHLTAIGFASGSKVLYGELFAYSYLSPYFDEASTDQKIRVRGYDDANRLIDTPWAGTAPVYEVPKSERPTDDTRLSIEFSLVDALDRDIVLMFSSFDALDNAIGDPNLLNSGDYPDLLRMQDVYFQRISERLNFRRFFEFFRWFDDSIGTFIEQLVPRKTNFKGTNFTISSHMLERHRIEYRNDGQYLGDSDRPVKNTLLLLQVVGICHKY